MCPVELTQVFQLSRVGSRGSSKTIFGVEGPTLPLEYYIYHVAKGLK